MYMMIGTLKMNLFARIPDTESAVVIALAPGIGMICTLCF